MSGARAADRAGSLLVPLYVHPAVDPAAWAAVAGMADRVHGVVVNLADGPGTRVDGVFAAAADRLRAAGIRLFGYVDSGYGKRPVRTLRREVGRHREWYGTRGVFVDRTASGAAQLPYYRRLVRACGPDPVVLNPGVHPDPGYARLADLLVTFEGSWAQYARAEVPAWTSLHPADRFCHLVYGVPGSARAEVARTAALRGAAVHCAVPGGPPNPWQSAPVVCEGTPTP